MITGWNYLCTDYEDDGENRLEVTYYERVKNMYGMVATIEIGRALKLDDDKMSEIAVVREYTKNIGGVVPWREFTLADYQHIRDDASAKKSHKRGNNHEKRYSNVY